MRAIRSTVVDVGLCSVKNAREQSFREFYLSIFHARLVLKALSAEQDLILYQKLCGSPLYAHIQQGEARE